MQVHRVALGRVLDAVGVLHGQHAALIGVGALVHNAVGLKVEAVGAVRVEGHLRALVVGSDRHALDLGALCRLLFDRLFDRLFLGVGIEIALDRAAGERPDRLGHKRKHLWVLGGVIGAVLIMLAHLHLGGALHLYGIGIGRHLGHGMGRGGGRHGAVPVIDIGTLGLHREHKTETGIIADHAARPGLHAVGVGQQLIVARAVERQRKVKEEAGVGVQQALGRGRDEFIVLHQIDIARVAVEAHGKAAAERRLAIARNRASVERPDRLGHEREHLGVLGGIVGAVLVVLAHGHLGGALHLHGIGISRHFGHGVGCGGGRHGAVFIGHIGTLGFCREDETETGIVADLAALPGLHAVGVGQQRVIARAVERQCEVEEEAGVGVQQALGRGGDEFIILHQIDIARVAVEAHGVAALALSGIAALSVRDHCSAAERQHAGEHDRRDADGDDEHGRHDRIGEIARPPGGVGVFMEGADDVIDHRDEQQHRGGQGHINGFLAAVAGVVVGHDAVADALDAVADEQHGRRRETGDHREGRKAHRDIIGKSAVEPPGQYREDDRSEDQRQDQAGIHAAEGIVIRGKAAEEQAERQHGQHQRDDADRQMHAGFFVGIRHDYCLLSFLERTSESAVKATVPTKLTPMMIRSVSTHQTTAPEEPESLVMPFRSELLANMKSFL